MLHLAVAAWSTTASKPAKTGVNDTRAGYTMRTKYKGHHNRNTQIRGTFSAGGDFLVCGSDDGWAYVWPTDAPAAGARAPRLASGCARQESGVT